MLRTIHRTVALLMLVCLFLACGAASATTPTGRARHVVVVVWDGMRPDLISEAHTPTLYKMMHDGTFFANHHPVYLSSTEVNGTAIATGAYPRTSGIVGNQQYRPDVELLKPIASESEFAAWHIDRSSGGRYIQMPTLAEIIRKAGHHTVVAGTKPVALLLDRNAADSDKGVNVFAGNSLPSAAMDKIRKDEGPFPPGADTRKTPNARQDAWTTRVLVKRLWARGVPTFSVLWMSDPDYSQHACGPASDNALKALKSCDDNLAVVLRALSEKGVRDKTDVMLVSDHGFSTVLGGCDPAGDLRGAGLEASSSFSESPKKGDVVVVGLGGSVFFYVADHDKKSIQKVVDTMQGTAYAGVILTRDGLPGTFTLKQAGLDSSTAPDVVVSLRWYDAPAGTGLPGLLMSTSLGAGQGMHGSLCKYDMHNTLVAAGPDFRQGFIDRTPSGNVDLAPTILAILGIKQPKPMDGRVLAEAMEGFPQSADHPESLTLETKLPVSHNRVWHQYLKITRLGEHTYYDEGNGTLTLNGLNNP